MKNLIKSRKGITLIALVITIVVIIIVGAVSLAALFRDDRNYTKINRC